MRIVSNLIWLCALWLTTSAQASNLSVVASYGWIGDLIKQVGGDQVTVNLLAQPDFDPHFVPPKPSLAVKLRNADLLVINGGQLEMGWLPPVLRQSANRRINPASEGFLDLSSYIKLRNPRPHATRADGDVHPDGNPHFDLNPYNFLILSQVVADKLCQLDQAHCPAYQQRQQDFNQRWQARILIWESKLAHLRGKGVVQYHESFDDMAHWLGMKIVANVEPVPGVPPGAGHLESLLNTLSEASVVMVIQEHFRDKEATQWLARQKGIPWRVLPCDVGADERAKDLFSWYDLMTETLAQ